MGCKFSFKRVFLVASLCLAGLFGISSVVINEQVKETPVVEKAEAAIPSYIYFSYTTAWNNGCSTTNLLDHTYVYYFGSSTPWDWPGKKLRDLGATVLEDSYCHLNIAKIPNPNNSTKVIFSCDQDGRTDNEKKTEDLTIPTDGGNFFLLLSNNYSGWFGFAGDQKGEWLEFDESKNDLVHVYNLPDWTEYGYETDTIYFAPSGYWCNNYGDNGRRIWPYLEIKFKNTIGEYDGLEAYPSGITTSTPNWTGKGDSIPFVFYYENIPVAQIEIMEFQASVSNNKWLRMNSTVRNKWCSSTYEHTANLFGTSRSDWGNREDSSTTYNSYYPTEAILGSKSYMVGSFLSNSDIKWSKDNNPSAVRDPEDTNILLGSSYPYEKTIDVHYGDAFKYVTFDHIENYAQNGQASNWGLAGWEDHGYDGSTNNHITVIDDGVIVATTPEEKAAIFPQYFIKGIGNDNYNFQFVKNGRVTFRRTTNSSSSPDITMEFVSTYPSTTTIDVTSHKPDSLRGDFNNWLGTDTSDLERLNYKPLYNATTGRYETVVAILNNDAFKFHSSDENYWYNIEVADIVKHNGATVEKISDNLKVTSGNGYYVFGFYVANADQSDTHTTRAQLFIDKLASIVDTEACAISFAKRLTHYKTCNLQSDLSNESEADVLNDLVSFYEACTYSGKNSTLASFSIIDYDYSDYINNIPPNSYDGLTPRTSTNAFAKYNEILRRNGRTPISNNAINNVFPYSINGDDNGTAIVIIASSISLLSITALSVLVIKKHKSKKQ